MINIEDPAILVLLVVPGSKVRSLLLRRFANLPTDLDPSSQEIPPFSVELLSSDTLATVLKLTGQSAPVLVLKQTEAEDQGGRSRGRRNQRREGQGNGQDLLAYILAAAEEEEDAPGDYDYPEQAQLSPREMEILGLLAQGASNQLLSQSLSISLNTVKTHVKNVMRKLKTTNREQTALVGKLIIQSKKRGSPETVGPLSGLLGIIERMS